jgi:hypothetical protein
MTHPKKHQHHYPTDRAVATAGLLRGTYIPQAQNWWASLFGISNNGLAQYQNGYMDSPTDRDSDDTASGGEAADTTSATGGAAGPM